MMDVLVEWPVSVTHKVDFDLLDRVVGSVLLCLSQDRLQQDGRFDSSLACGHPERRSTSSESRVQRE